MLQFLTCIVILFFQCCFIELWCWHVVVHVFYLELVDKYFYSAHCVVSSNIKKIYACAVLSSMNNLCQASEFSGVKSSCSPNPFLNTVLVQELCSRVLHIFIILSYILPFDPASIPVDLHVYSFFWLMSRINQGLFDPNPCCKQLKSDLFGSGWRLEGTVLSGLCWKIFSNPNPTGFKPVSPLEMLCLPA